MGFPGGAMLKNPAANKGDVGLIPWSEKSPGVESGNLFQYSCMENFLDRGAWWATNHMVGKESDMTGQLSTASLNEVIRVEL